jgi:hypothetical protein
MPDASKPRAPGIPGDPKSPKIGDTVGELTPKPIKPAQTPKTILKSQQLDFPVTPVTSDNYKSYFSNSANLQPKNRQKVFKDLASSSSSSVSVINMPLPPITVGNTNPGSIPVPSGNPTPLPFISPINLLYEEDMALNAVNLGILA